MSFLAALVRLIALEVFLSLPWIGLGWAVAGYGGVLTALLLFYFLILAVGFTAEKIVARSHHALEECPIGLQRTLSRVLEQAGIPVSRSPRLLLFPDPVPNAVIARSLGSNGLILISQGLVSRMSEQELRSVIRHCVKSCRPTTTAATSICAVFASATLRLAPKRWVEMALESESCSPSRKATDLGPLGAVGFLIFFPLARILIKLGGRIKWDTEKSTSEMQTAMLKIQTSLSGWDLGWNPGFDSLYLAGFQARKAILPINFSH